jgi:hypothetical protein
MQSDPIIDEVRRIRAEIMSQYGNDPDAYYRHLRRAQKAHGDRLVSFKPKPLVTPTVKKTAA